MKRIFFMAFAFLPLFAMANVYLIISDGIDNDVLKRKMEMSVSNLLTEINAAQTAGRSVKFSGLNLNSSVQESISMLWENSPFMCTDEEIVEHCITTGSGYQIRNIPLLMKPLAKDKFNETEYQEAVISFNRNGEVESFYLSIAMNLYMNVIRDNMEITDLRRRQLILDYVEQFRTSYNTKDLDFLKQVFSEDALIITGRVIKATKDNIKLPDKIIYKQQSKKEYIDHLARLFARNSYIKVTFDEIKVMRHPTNVNYYGVTLHQGYSSSTYHDDGYLFILWDFTDEEHPKIHVRTWQPDKINGNKLPEDEIFSLSDFDL